MRAEEVAGWLDIFVIDTQPLEVIHFMVTGHATRGFAVKRDGPIDREDDLAPARIVMEKVCRDEDSDLRADDRNTGRQIRGHVWPEIG